MPAVAFVAPFFLDATLRFVDATASLPGVDVALVSQDPIDKLPAGLRAKLAAHHQVADGLDPQQIADAVRAVPVGPIRKVFGALEQLQVPLALARQTLGLPGMSVETAQNFRDKARMKTVLREAGVPCARHRLARSVDDVRAFVDEVGLPVVAKPTAGAGARNTFRLDTMDALREWLAVQPPNPADPALLEEFLTGDEHSFDSVVIDGRLVWWSVSRYYPTPLEVLRNPWMQWVVLVPRDLDEFAAIRDVGAAALHALGLQTALTHMEWFRLRDGRVAVSEVAARPPGAQFTSLLSYAHDRDFYRAWAQLMVYDEFDPPERQYAVGAVYLRGQGEGRVRAVHGLDELQQEIGGLVVEARLPSAGEAPSGTYEGDGYIVVRHPETRVVEQALARVVHVARVELG